MKLTVTAIAFLFTTEATSAFVHRPSVHMMTTDSPRRRTLLASSFLGGIFGGGGDSGISNAKPTAPGSKGPTGEVIRNVNGMKHRRLGGSDIAVSELGLGTQRWVSTDFNAPDEQLWWPNLFLGRVLHR